MKQPPAFGVLFAFVWLQYESLYLGFGFELFFSLFLLGLAFWLNGFWEIWSLLYITKIITMIDSERVGMA